jgi:GDPmannose 4,6-dehydratase
MKCVLIIGVNGQDGTYLTDLLISKNYIVHGIVRQKSQYLTNKILQNQINKNRIKVHNIDVLDIDCLRALILDIKPNEIYYLATTHELKISKANYHEVMSINISGLINILEIAKHNMPTIKIFYSSSSNVFAGSKESPQNEKTIKVPQSLYGIAKLTAMNLINLYKNDYNLFACYGILYNHESILRKKIFLPMKIVDGAVNISLGRQKKLLIGSIEDIRDWGCAKEYVYAMWLMLQARNPNNYVVGTGKIMTVKDVVSIVFAHLNLDWKKFIEIDKSFSRDIKTVPLIADSKKIKQDLGWFASRDFKYVLKEMIEEDLKIKQG